MDINESELDSNDDSIIPDDGEDYKLLRGEKKHAKHNVVPSDDEYNDICDHSCDQAKSEARATVLTRDYLLGQGVHTLQYHRLLQH